MSNMVPNIDAKNEFEVFEKIRQYIVNTLPKSFKHLYATWYLGLKTKHRI